MNKHFRKKHLTKFVLFPKFPELDFLLTFMGKWMHTEMVSAERDLRHDGSQHAS